MHIDTSRRFTGWQRALLAALAGAAMAAHGQAESEATADVSGLRLSAFGSVGVTHVDAPVGWGYRRELNQRASDANWRHDADTRLGVQLNYSLGSQFELVAQAIARKRAGYASHGDALEWAYATYRPNTDWTLRAGRVNLDAFLMADYRNVGYGFMTARPPVELYAILPTTLDGADLARSWFQGDAQWRAKLMAGESRIGALDGSEAGHLHNVVGIVLSREEGGLLLRASAARATVRTGLSSAQAAIAGLNQLGGLPIPAVADTARLLLDRMGASGASATFLELGVRYELADWQWSAEVVRIDSAPIIKQTSAYATVGRRIGDWTPYAGYGRTREGLPVLAAPAWAVVLAPVIGPAGAAGAQTLGSAVAAGVNSSRVHQSTVSFGARWDFHPQAALKLQWDRVRVAGNGSGLWIGAQGAAGRAHVATAVVDFIF